MNANAKKWVRALKSGKYRQGKNFLRKNDKFCCLGVACELAVKAGIIGAPEKDNEGIYNYAGKHMALPLEVQTWVGLDHREGRVEGKNSNFLTHLNDSGRRFTTIARIIESEPKGLFKS